MPIRPVTRWFAVAAAAATAVSTLAASPDPTMRGADGLAVVGDQLFVATGNSVDRWDVSDPAAPVRDWTFAHAQAEYGDEDLSVGGGLLLALVPPPIESDTEPVGGGALDPVVPCDGSCVLHVFDITGDDPVLLSMVPMSGVHTLSCLADCRWALGARGDVLIDLRDPEAPRVTSVDGGYGAWHHVQWVDEATLAATAGSRTEVFDVSDPTAPERLASWAAAGRSANHVVPARGTSVAFVGEFGMLDGGCGVRWFDTTLTTSEDHVEAMHRWDPAQEPTLPSTHLNGACMSDPAVHPQFADTPLLAVALGEDGLVLLEFTGTELALVDQVSRVEAGVLGAITSVAWISPDTVAYVQHEGGLGVHRFELA